MKKILCPTDFSGAANNAIAYAGKLAHATNSELTLLNVQSLFDYSPIEVVSAEHSPATFVKRNLESQCDEVIRTFKIVCNAEVETGFSRLSSVIREKAQDFDLIVMGTDGADDLYEFFSGSNTYRAIEKTKTPVLVIPSGCIYSEIKSMVYSFDYLRERNLPLARLVPFVKALKCELTILEVMEEAYSKDAEEDLRELQFILKTMYSGDIDYEFDTIRSSDVASSINSYILRNQPDVLALCSVHRNIIGKLFHKSIIKNISAVCSYPVYVFHS
jgi:nucleotide-binding universal stress UspA family protein